MIDKQALASSLEKTLSKPVFQAAIAKALAESLISTFCDIQQDQLDLAEHLRQAKPPEAFGPGLKVMGHAIVNNTGNPQWDRKRVELLDYCKVSGKYLVRTIYPQGCGANEITWIDRELINHPQCDQEYPQPAKPPKQQAPTQLPDGWRWLEVGEVIRKGDLPCKHGLIYATEPIMLGMTLQEHWKPMIRRNRFNVGEKVVRVFSECVYEITAILDRGCYEMQTPSGYKIRLYAKDLAPYIEDSK